MAYKCISRTEIRDGIFSIRAVQPCHIEFIRQWRNAQMDVLRQPSVLTSKEQEAYYHKYIWPDMCSLYPRNILLVYLENDNLIGYGGLVHIAWEHRRAEISFLLAPQLATISDNYTRYFSKFLCMMKILAFDDLGFERLFTETYAMREHHIQVLETTGFRREGVLKHHVQIDDQPADSVIHGCLTEYKRECRDEG